MRAQLAAIGLICAVTAGQAQDYSAEELAKRTIQRRAVEAMNWGMSAVNTDLMLQEMLNKTAGKVNQVIYWSRPLDWHNQTLTPNPDAIYFMAFFNTKDAGPIVLEIPPAGDDGSLNGNIVDFWQAPLEDAGPSGADAGKGGKYLLLPPGYASSVPEGLHRAAARDVRQLRAAALEPEEPRRCRCRQVGGLWQAGEGLSALAGRQSAGDSVHRRGERGVRLHHPLRRKLLHVARPRRTERTVAAARPGDDRHVAFARHREGKAVQSRCQDQGRARRGRSRGEGLA